uniref:very low-density lipoprotein receptor-like isoform X2 n=1 Tax=Myxine glutinosa TaxID=7769 RepID=UPI00358E0184
MGRISQNICDVKTGVDQGEEGCPDGHFTCGNGQCVRESWRCDGRHDCRDHTDEDPTFCVVPTCSVDEFDCKAGNGTERHCITHIWVCDGELDCEDGADEDDCPPTTCHSHEFACTGAAKCVDRAFMCDGDDDCPDASDEHGCRPLECGATELACDGRCIPANAVCDGRPDCTNGEDESTSRCGNRSRTNIMTTSCGGSEFLCGSGECVHALWHCDGDPDCKDASDEDGCLPKKCEPDELQCDDGNCIPGVAQCDGHRHCADGSDEIGCSNYTTSCNHEEFRCGTGQCILKSQVCDGRKDCRDWSDEPLRDCHKDECLDNNGGCSHICRDLKFGYECDCPAGFALEDTRTCDDVDECKLPGTCSQLCTNFKGGFKCHCYAGYSMDPYTKSCKAKGQPPFLIFANRMDVRRVDLHSGEYLRIVPQTRNTVAVAVEVNSGHIYWADLGHRKIYSAPMLEADDVTKHTVVLGDPGVSANGLAVDWIHRNIYWTDSVKKTLGVAKLGSLRQKTLFNYGLSEPSAVAVDPLKGFVYWSDWGVKAKIEKAGMNGNGRRTLVSSDIEWPNGITLDLLNERLYWADSKLHSLSSVDLDGGDRRTVVQSSSHVQHPYAIAIFEDMVFWLDGQSEAIFKANKFTGQGVQPVVQHLKSAQDLLVHHQLLQPEGTDWCSNAGLANGGCEFLCLPAPQITARSAKYTCVCPDGAQLHIDGLRCQPGPVSSFQLPNSLESPSHKERIAIQTSTHSHIADFQHPTQQVQVATSQASAHSGTTILSVLLPIALLTMLAFGALLFWRNWRRRNRKSINFVNPVYRKTTAEDELSIGTGAYPKNIYKPITQVNTEIDE